MALLHRPAAVHHEACLVMFRAAGLIRNSQMPDSTSIHVYQGTVGYRVSFLDMEHDIGIRRIYDPPGGGEGQRVLVDRLWPRGVSRERAGLDHWFRDLAPSSDLRKWFGHDPERWEEFCRRYREELRDRGEEIEALVELTRNGPVTLLYGARDRERNQAVVLRRVLREMLAGFRST